MSPVPILVGRYVPLTICAESGSIVAAASLNVRFTPVTSRLPPVSDIRITLCPPGPTNKMSISSGKVCVKPLSVTVRLVTVPLTPATVIFDG